jgi:hypothetical protein
VISHLHKINFYAVYVMKSKYNSCNFDGSKAISLTTNEFLCCICVSTRNIGISENWKTRPISSK